MHLESFGEDVRPSFHPSFSPRFHSVSLASPDKTTRFKICKMAPLRAGCPRGPRRAVLFPPLPHSDVAMGHAVTTICLDTVLERKFIPKTAIHHYMTNGNISLRFADSLLKLVLDIWLYLKGRKCCRNPRRTKQNMLYWLHTLSTTPKGAPMVSLLFYCLNCPHCCHHQHDNCLR